MNVRGPWKDGNYEKACRQAIRVLRMRHRFDPRPYRRGKRVATKQTSTIDDNTALLLAEIAAQIGKNRSQTSPGGAAADPTGLEGGAAFDQEWLSNFLLRWASAEESLVLKPREAFSEQHGAEVVIKHDIPILLSELARWRRDLSFRAGS